MSLPPELRVLCHQLSSTATTDLPSFTPILLQNVLRCRGPLSSPQSSTSKADSSESAVLVHKLKTQVSTLLYGKSAEGRFAAVVLVKGIVDVGGWEVLRGAESWVRGLLAILGKPDPLATKRLSILTLTSIYLVTHQYQSLVREITTPTLPTFVSSCLNLISPKSSGKSPTVPLSFLEIIFEAFSTLIPRHPTIFRPFANQIRHALRPFVAPTVTDKPYVPTSLRKSARRLAVHLHQTAAKNASGEEWGKSVRDLITEIHGTADQVFRAVIEDWESNCGYVSQNVDMNQEINGAAKSETDFSSWVGIDAGLERLTGLLGFLESHFRYQTTTAVTIPVGLIVDLLTRLLSIVPPTSSVRGKADGGARLHPSVERNERETLWAGLPLIFTAAISVYITLIDRLQEGFMSLAQSCLENVMWTFASGQNDELYRATTYRLVRKVILFSGPSLPKATTEKIFPVGFACCSEFRSYENILSASTMTAESLGKSSLNGSSANADELKQGKASLAQFSKSAVLLQAEKLLPFLLSHLPQEYLSSHLRIEIDRTAIISGKKDTMIASIMNPYPRKSGVGLPSILPHLCRAFPNDAATQAILRPRMPIIQSQVLLSESIEEPEKSLQGHQEDDVMGDIVVGPESPLENSNAATTHVDHEDEKHDVEPIYAEETAVKSDHWKGKQIIDSQPIETESSSTVAKAAFQSAEPAPKPSWSPRRAEIAITAEAVEDDSDSGSSVHLVMELSDSE